MAKNHKKLPREAVKISSPETPKVIQQPYKKEPQAENDIEINSNLITFTDTELQLITKLQDIRKSKIIYLIAGDSVQIQDDVSNVAYNLLRELGKTERIDMILNSRGGRTEVPAKLVPLIRNFCNTFSVIIPYRAQSAATHIALGANEIIMGPMSELGPVDPSRTHPLLPKDKDGNPIPISVQDLKHVMELLKREGPENSYTPDALATIFSTMFEYIHPLAMGAIEQSYALAKLISKKLLATHMDPVKDKDKIDLIANELSDNFKSHSYQIGWQEAKNLGLPITFDDGEIYEIAWNFFETISETLEPPPSISGGSKMATRPIMAIGTEISKRVLFELSEPIKEGNLTKFKPITAKWLSSADLKKE